MLLLERLHPSIMVMLSQIKLQSLSQHNEFTVNTLRVMWVFIINSCRSFNLRVFFFAISIQISIRLVKKYIFFCLRRTLIIQHFHSSFQIISLHRYTALIFTPSRSLLQVPHWLCLSRYHRSLVILSHVTILDLCKNIVLTKKQLFSLCSWHEEHHFAINKLMITPNWLTG